MPDSQVHFERYLQSLQRFGPPDDIDRILRKLGDAEAVLARHAELTKILEGRARWRWVKDLMKEGAAWIVGVGAAIVMLYGGYTFLHRAPPPPPVPAVEIVQ